MKPTSAIVISLLALCSVAHSQVDSTSPDHKWRCDIEMGKQAPGTFNDFFGLAEWEQRYSIRAGIGKGIYDHLLVEAFLEHRRYASTTLYGDNFPWHFVRSYTRSEVALYTSLTALGFLQAGIGAIAQWHEEIVYYETTYEHTISDIPRMQPAAQRFKLFYTVGLKYDISMGARFSIPIGIYMDMFWNKYDVQAPTLRLGITKEFN